MVAFRRTSTDIDHPVDAPQERWGPQFFVRLEFGVSFTSKTPAKKHQVVYHSRSRHDRKTSSSRKVAAPDTNCLAAIPDFQHKQDSQTKQQRTQEWLQQQRHYHDQYSPLETEPQSWWAHPTTPFGLDPWDPNVLQPPPEPTVATSAAAPSASSDMTKPADAGLMKALPIVPSQFRLGEDGLPWSAWSWPHGSEPSEDLEDYGGGSGKATGQDEDQPAAQNSQHSLPPACVDPQPLDDVVTPLTASVFSPGFTAAAPSTPLLSVDAVTPNTPSNSDITCRAHELEALGAALMTVDNGFESQWWNSGERPSSVAAEGDGCSLQSLGWAVASTLVDGRR